MRRTTADGHSYIMRFMRVGSLVPLNWHSERANDSRSLPWQPIAQRMCMLTGDGVGGNQRVRYIRVGSHHHNDFRTADIQGHVSRVQKHHYSGCAAGAGDAAESGTGARRLFVGQYSCVGGDSVLVVAKEETTIDAPSHTQQACERCCWQA